MMHAPSYRLIDPESPTTGLPETKAVEFTWPGDGGARRREVVGFVTPEDGGFRAWKSNEMPVERLFRPMKASQHDAVALLLPETDFPRTCVRCGVNEPTGDAAAYTKGQTGPAYHGILDDHCEDCLEAGAEDLADRWAEEAAADAAAREV